MMINNLRKELEMDNTTVVSGICELGEFCFKIPCYSKVMIVDGDSGSGKTYFIRKLKYYLQPNIPEKNKISLSCGFDTTMMHALLHPAELDGISDYLAGNLFLIDRFNKVTTEQLKKVQHLVDNGCIFLLLCRNVVPIHDGGIDTNLKLYVSMLGDMEYFKFDF